MTESAILSRAARISASDTGLVVIAITAKLDENAGARLDGLPVNVIRRGEILDCEPKRLEQRDLIRRPATFDFFDKQISDLTGDVVVANRTLLFRKQEVPCLVQR